MPDFVLIRPISQASKQPAAREYFDFDVVARADEENESGAIEIPWVSTIGYLGKAAYDTVEAIKGQ